MRNVRSRRRGFIDVRLITLGDYIVLAAGLLVPMGVRGVYGRGADFERAIERFDALVTKEGAQLSPEMMRFPPVFSRRNYEKIDHIHNFPDLMGSLHTFTGGEKEQRDRLGRFERREDWSRDLAASQVMMTPAICYPLYPTATGTLPAGVYKATSSAAIAAGNLTLDGGGNPQSVFIFQIGSTLTTTLNGTTSGNVILQNGASACNIYWQIGSSATLGGATFYGDVFAFSSITLNASNFTGRALAGGPSLGTGAVSIPVAGGSLITNPGGS